MFIILLFVASEMLGDLYFRQGTTNKGGVVYHNIGSLAGYLGEDISKNLVSFHALTGSDFTFPFFRRSKYQAYKVMVNKTKSVSLLNSLGRQYPNLNEIIDFVIHTIYNRPKKEETLKDTRIAMFLVKKGKKTDYNSTKLIPPDKEMMKMKILRAHYVSYMWKNCLNGRYTHLDPCEFGWVQKCGMMAPLWYEGSNLPSDEEYYAHINARVGATDSPLPDFSDSSDSDSEFDSDEENPLSDYDSSSDDEV